MSESEFMLREPQEYQPDRSDVERKIVRAGESDADLILVAESNHELAGFVHVRGSYFQRIRHSAVVLLAVRLNQEIGFEIEGTKHNAVLIGDRYYDDHVMDLLCREVT